MERPAPPALGDLHLTRRALLARMGTGVAAFSVATAVGRLPPAEARAQRAPLGLLSDEEASTLGALGDVLLPGAEEVGIVHFVDDQLGRADPLFILRYMDWPGPYPAFYRGGLAALDALGRARHGQPFAACTAEQRVALVGEIAGTMPEGWDGPPAPLFSYVVRNDAADVVYGGPEGYAKLGIPYMAHIMPPEGW